MYGGFPNGLSPASWRWSDRNVAANPTVLNGGNLSNRVVSATNLGSHPVLSVFDGFTVQGANGTSTAGGMFVTATGAGVSCGPVVRNCTFRNNVGVNGGGVGLSGSTSGVVNPSFTNCTFQGNTATGLGGGIYVVTLTASVANVALTNCLFQNNTAFIATTALAKGGAIANAPSGAGSQVNMTVTNCSFVNNSSEEWGGAVYNLSKTSGVIAMTFNGGTFSGNTGNSGSALHNWANGSASTVTFNGTVFSGNSATSAGGAVRNYCDLTGGNGTVTFNGCRFLGNTSSNFGGAVVNHSINNGVATMNINACRFETNDATQRGGCIYAYSSTRNATYPVTAATTNVDNSIFFNNTAGLRSASVYNEAVLGAPSTVNLRNSTFANNRSANGPGAYNTGVSPAAAVLNVTNCIYWGNAFTATGDGLFNNVSSGATINARNSSLQLATITANEVGTGVFNNLAGNIAGDPLFVNYALGDLRLTAASPCVNTGMVVALTTDFDGNARPQGGAYDMGAYEFGGVRIEAREPQAVETAAKLSATVYPNPTSGVFTVSFDREVTGFAQVFDLQGRLVVSEQINGTNTANFDLGSEPTGAYLVRIVAGEEVLTKQVVVSKP